MSIDNYKKINMALENQLFAPSIEGVIDFDFVGSSLAPVPKGSN